MMMIASPLRLRVRRATARPTTVTAQAHRRRAGPASPGIPHGSWSAGRAPGPLGWPGELPLRRRSLASLRPSLARRRASGPAAAGLGRAGPRLPGPPQRLLLLMADAACSLAAAEPPPLSLSRAGGPRSLARFTADSDSLSLSRPPPPRPNRPSRSAVPCPRPGPAHDADRLRVRVRVVGATQSARAPTPARHRPGWQASAMTAPCQGLSQQRRERESRRDCSRGLRIALAGRRCCGGRPCALPCGPLLRCDAPSARQVEELGRSRRSLSLSARPGPRAGPFLGPMRGRPLRLLRRRFP